MALIAVSTTGCPQPIAPEATAAWPFVAPVRVRSASTSTTRYRRERALIPGKLSIQPRLT